MGCTRTHQGTGNPEPPRLKARAVDQFSLRMGLRKSKGQPIPVRFSDRTYLIDQYGTLRRAPFEKEQHMTDFDNTPTPPPHTNAPTPEPSPFENTPPQAPPPPVSNTPPPAVPPPVVPEHP